MRAVALGLVGLLAGTLVGLLLVPPPPPDDAFDADDEPEASGTLDAAGFPGSDGNRDGSGIERFALNGTLGTHAGVCGDPLTGCQNLVGQQWVDLRLAPSRGATRIVAFLNWSSDAIPRTLATDNLQVRILVCGDRGGCGTNPTVLARGSDLEVGVNGGDHSIVLDAKLPDDLRGDALYARVSTDEARLPAESTPHASALGQAFALRGWVYREA